MIFLLQNGARVITKRGSFFITKRGKGYNKMGQLLRFITKRGKGYNKTGQLLRFITKRGVYNKTGPYTSAARMETKLLTCENAKFGGVV